MSVKKLPKFLVYADVDGVMTPCKKLFNCVPQGVGTSFEHDKPLVPIGSMPAAEFIDTRWYKEFSDRDSFVMRHMKEELVFISNDKRNQHYANYKSHKFCFVSHDQGDKLEGLKTDWVARVINCQVSGDPEKPMYFYIGDTPFDWSCLTNAMMGFMPRDSSPLLQLKAQLAMKLTTANSQVMNSLVHLESCGGNGCLEEMMVYIANHDCGISSKFEVDIAGMGVVKAIHECLSM